MQKTTEDALRQIRSALDGRADATRALAAALETIEALVREGELLKLQRDWLDLVCGASNCASTRNWRDGWEHGVPGQFLWASESGGRGVTDGKDHGRWPEELAPKWTGAIRFPEGIDPDKVRIGELAAALRYSGASDARVVDGQILGLSAPVPSCVGEWEIRIGPTPDIASCGPRESSPAQTEESSK